MATQVACDLLAIVGRYDALTVRVYGISTNPSAVPTKNCYGALVHKRDEYGVTAEHEAAILADCARGMVPSSLRHLRCSSSLFPWHCPALMKTRLLAMAHICCYFYCLYLASNKGC
jgi:hypothetical protein